MSSPCRCAKQEGCIDEHNSSQSTVRRKQESEADVIGIHLSARACFDPTAAVDVFTKLGEAERSQGIQTPTFLRTHPLSEVRAFRSLLLIVVKVE